MQGIPLRGGHAEGTFLDPSTSADRMVSPKVLVGPTLSVRSIPDLVSQGYVGAVVRATAIGEDRPGTDPSEFPVVGGLDGDVFRSGDRGGVDGGAGTVRLDGIEEVAVVTSFLVNSEDRVLLLRRSERVGTFQGRWAGVSGFLEDPTAEAQARREIREETGLGSDDVLLEESGRPIYARDGQRIFVVHPFRFRVLGGSVRLDWEHTELAWVPPEEIPTRPTVPKLLEAWKATSRGASSSTARNE